MNNLTLKKTIWKHNTRILLLFFLIQQTFVNAEVIYTLELEGQKSTSAIYWNGKPASNLIPIYSRLKNHQMVLYHKIGEIPAAGYSENTKDYRFLDTGIGENKVFYRLKLEEDDGTNSYSRTIVINRQSTNYFMIAHIASTTSSDFFSFSIDAIKEGVISYTVYDLQNKVISKEEQNIINGINHFNINLIDQKVGHYKVSFSMSSETEFIIVHKIIDPKAQKPNVASSTKSKSKM